MRARLAVLVVAALATAYLPASAGAAGPLPIAGMVLAVKTDAGLAHVLTPPNFNCSYLANTPTFVALDCVPVNAEIHGPCPDVTAEAQANAAPGATASATSTCNGGSATATATAVGHDQDTAVALTLPWNCTFNFSPNLTNGWASCGGW